MITTTRFTLGEVVATPDALQALAGNGQTLAEFLHRHGQGDWGCVCDEDKRLNDDAIAHEGDPDQQRRVLSVYFTTDKTKLYVISESDRSVTTLLLASEY